MFFALLDLRTAELGIAKVWSHIEGVADLAIKAGEAQLCDIIGNALADEAAAIAAKLLRPTPIACKSRESIHRLAFNICIRLAFSQAREWELLDDTRIYEAPPEFIETDTTIGTAFQKDNDELTESGHDLSIEWRGKIAGHLCARCEKFRAKANFNEWLNKGSCVRIATGLERKAAFETRFTVKVRKEKATAEHVLIFDTDSEEERSQKSRRTTTEGNTQVFSQAEEQDSKEAEEVNE